MKKLFYILIFITEAISAQQPVPQNLPVYDVQSLHFGMALGYNKMDFTVHNSLAIYTLDSVYSIENHSKPGFNINIVSNFNLHRYWSFRVLPGLNFGQRDLEFVSHSRKDSIFFKKVMMIESTFLDVPFLLKYKAKRINNFRPYLIAGGAFKWDLAAQKAVQDDEKPKIRLKPLNTYYAFGVGMDFFMQYFKFALELKLEVGTRNVLVPDRFQYAQSIDRLNSKIIHVTALFEGSDIRSFTSLFHKDKSRSRK